MSRNTWYYIDVIYLYKVQLLKTRIIIIVYLTVCKQIIIILLLRVLTQVLADGFSLESERHQVSSSLQDSSHYSGRS